MEVPIQHVFNPGALFDTFWDVSMALTSPDNTREKEPP